MRLCGLDSADSSKVALCTVAYEFFLDRRLRRRKTPVLTCRHFSKMARCQLRGLVNTAHPPKVSNIEQKCARVPLLTFIVTKCKCGLVGGRR